MAFSITFNTLLENAGIQLSDVLLLRHSNSSSSKGLTSFDVWRHHKDDFEVNQSRQRSKSRKTFARPYWAAFVVTPRQETLFVGLYTAKFCRPINEDVKSLHSDVVDIAGTHDEYQTALSDQLSEYSSKLVIDWGGGKKSWRQRADNKKPKQITELRICYEEERFPGFIDFRMALSQLAGIPNSWAQPLRSTHGIYVLTCPKTKELYVGKASGGEGFLGRWESYITSGHGGNVALKGRPASDYQVAILEVAGSAASESDLSKMENRWKHKLQSREIGLNRN